MDCWKSVNIADAIFFIKGVMDDLKPQTFNDYWKACNGDVLGRPGRSSIIKQPKFFKEWTKLFLLKEIMFWHKHEAAVFKLQAELLSVLWNFSAFLLSYMCCSHDPMIQDTFDGKK